MLGTVIGDTVGSVYEFHNTKDYNFRLLSPRSNFTDDSVMSFAIADWLVKDPTHSYEELEKCMLTIANNFPCPMGGYGGGFHKWLFIPWALQPFDSQNGELPYHSPTDRYPYGSWGNGSAMRASACGWFFETLEETEHVAGISAAITHNHPEGIKGAQATAAAIWMGRNGYSKDDIRSYIESKYGYDLQRTWEQLHPVYHWDSSCQGTVPEAIIAFLDSTDFEDAIRKAVSLGGDSDTLACITGGIAEAYYKTIPAELAEAVYNKLPKYFQNILEYMKGHTDYGQLFQKHNER